MFQQHDDFVRRQGMVIAAVLPQRREDVQQRVRGTGVARLHCRAPAVGVLRICGCVMSPGHCILPVVIVHAIPDDGDTAPSMPRCCYDAMTVCCHRLLPRLRLCCGDSSPGCGGVPSIAFRLRGAVEGWSAAPQKDEGRDGEASMRRSAGRRLRVKDCMRTRQRS